MNLDPSLEKSLDRLISVAMDSHKRYHHAALDVPCGDVHEVSSLL